MKQRSRTWVLKIVVDVREAVTYQQALLFRSRVAYTVTVRSSLGNGGMMKAIRQEQLSIGCRKHGRKAAPISTK
jgi:hypothetical protein